MIVDSGKYYLYRHIRLDTGKPFYIGIGTRQDKLTHKQYYYRAFRKANRNKHWKNIISKTDYRVEIVLESDSLDFVITKEIEFIELYKKYLSNKTSGGEINKTINKNSIKRVIKINKKIALEKRLLFEQNYKNDIIYDYNVNKYSINKLYKKYKKYPKTIKNILIKNNEFKNEICYKCTTYYIYNYLLDSITEIYGNLKNISEFTKIHQLSLQKMIKGNNFKKRNFLVSTEKLEKNHYKKIYEKRAEN